MSDKCKNCAKLKRERDEAREEVKRLVNLLDLAEDRLQQLVSAYNEAIRAQKWLGELMSENRRVDED